MVKKTRTVVGQDGREAKRRSGTDSTAGGAVKQAAKPATKAAAKQSDKPAAKVATKQVAEQAAKPAAKPAPKPAAKAARPTAAKPAARSRRVVADPATVPVAPDAIPMAYAAGRPLSGAVDPSGSLADILIRAAGHDDLGITFVEGDGSERRYRYAELLELAARRLAGLRAAGLTRGEMAPLIVQRNFDFIVTYWACMLGGIIPVPLAYPNSFTAPNTALGKIHEVWLQLDKPPILGDRAMFEKLDAIGRMVPVDDMRVLVAAEHDGDATGIEYTPGRDHELAFIQYSSGSTGSPKGVALTHRNLLTNVEAIMLGCAHQPGETVLSWMPFSHDMGLIGMHLFPVAGLASCVNIPPHAFVRRPMLWLEKVAEHRAAVTSSPNFGYRLALDSLTDEHRAKLDLSCVRIIFNGAEPISVPLVREFLDTFAVTGLKREAMFTVYGMAEASVATSFPPPGEAPRVHCIHRRILAERGEVERVDETHPEAMLVADEGIPVAASELRVVDDEGVLLTEGRVGHVQIRGDNVTRGYHRNPEATREVLDGDWLRTGDLGFMLDGRLCITGRSKDIVIVNGQKFFAYDIEACAQDVPGVANGKVAVSGWHDHELGRERVVMFLSLRGDLDCRQVMARVWHRVSETFGIALDAIVKVKQVPRTTSGKVQRFRLRKSFLAGEFANDVYDMDTLLDIDLEALPEIAREAAGTVVEVAASVEPVTTEAVAAEAIVDDAVEEDAVEDDVIEDVPIAYTAETLRPIIRAAWSEALQRAEDRIADDRSFQSLGGTSVKAVRILGALERRLDTVLSHDFLLQCRTVADMADYLERHLAGDGHAEPAPTVIGEIAESGEEIAIIGMACRFPDADTPDAFWRNLLEGRDSITDVPADRWNADLHYTAGTPRPGKSVSRWGGFVDAPFAFDAGFFGISPEEAAIMDPQQRLFAQCAYKALDRAGHAGAGSEGGRVGVFVGASHNNYMEHHLHGMDLLRLQQFDSFNALPEAQREALLAEWKLRFGDVELHANTAVDNLLNMIAARTSQLLNLKGPSLAIDTACSSSLVAVHLACDSLRRGECEIAIAGGVNLNLSPTPYLLFSRAGALSPTGRCRVFDADADGFVPGEGVGAVVLKPLAKAQADGDRILAVIKRSFVNNDGRSLGPMAPNPEGQRVAIASVYRDDALRPDQIQYVEAHGTGTPIGDPSEMRSLIQVYREHGVAPGACAVGSVKANIGHLLAAAGVASLIKLVLALEHRQMPPSLHVERPNPQIDFERSPFRLLSKPTDWAAPASGRRRGAINSFGFGGTNCHMVIEEAPETVAVEAAATRSRHLLCLSARSPAALSRQALSIARHLQAHPELSPVDVAHTLHTGRAHHEYRLGVVGDSLDALATRLLAAAEQVSERRVSGVPAVALMFTGQGSQYPGMAARLYESLPAFRAIVDACAAAFDPHLERPLLASLYDHASDARALAQTRITQPVVFTIDYAIGRLLLDWGVKPACMLGHSVGEYAAACLAGVMSLADAAKIVAARGRLMSALPEGGGMLAVFDRAEALAPMLEVYRDRLWFGAHNGAHQVVSGELDAIAQLQVQLQTQGKACKALQVSHAFHTPLMAPMLAEFGKVLATVEFRAPLIPLVSNIGGEWIESRALEAGYWADHVLAPVAFEQSVRLAADRGIDCFVECGPDKILTGLTRSVLEGREVAIVPTLDRRRDDWESLLGAVADLYRNGATIDWRAYDAGLPVRRVELPGYPFERSEHRIRTSDPAPVQAAYARTPAPASLRVAEPAMVAADVVAPSQLASMQPTPMPPAPAQLAPAQLAPAPAAALRDWSQVLRDMVAGLVSLPPARIDMNRNFNDLGIDSAAAVKLAEQLGELTGLRFPSTLLFEFQSPVALVEHLRSLHLPDPVAPAAPAAIASAVVPAPLPASSQGLGGAPLPATRTPAVADPGERALRDHDVAIIGMACRLPGADTPEAFWDLLMDSRIMIRAVDEGQWSTDDYFDPENRQAHMSYSKWAAFIDRPYDFDPMFFGISPREAEAMDPQQRLFLEVAWEALQQSGYGGDFRTRDIGVFVGCEQNHYGEHFIIHQRFQALRQRYERMPWFQAMPESERLQLLSTMRDVMQPAELISDAVAGQGLNEIAARVSHWLDLRGPNLMVNTACSSSMVALHLACQSLRAGESKLAIAGAAYLTGNDSPFVFLSRVGALSPNGQCAPFDEKANGMVLGEGISAVVLKPLKDAVRDGDHIHAVIKGSAVNNDGHSNGITAPNPRGQAEALRRAYVNAGMTPEAVSYIECHGTGTPLGDPVEIDGMTQAFRRFTDRNGFCAIGSIKSSVGHMLSGSSLPSLMKVAMALQHRVIPPTAGFTRPNPHIDLSTTPFHVVAGRPMSWQPVGDEPLRAGVNSFGFGGTNAHVVLEEPPVLPSVELNADTQLLLLSGRTQPVLQQVAARLRDHLQAHPAITPAQVCLSANGSQRDLAFKAALRVGDRADLLAKLDALAAGREVADVEVRRGNPKQIVQWALVLDGTMPMGAEEIDELIACFPELQQICDECKRLYADAMRDGNALNQHHLDDLLYAFALQYGLGRVLMTAELKPAAIVAEGTGVLAAACLLGMMELRQAVELLGRFALGRLESMAFRQGSGDHAERWNCPLLIPGATVHGQQDQIAALLSGYLRQPRRLTAQDLQELPRELVFAHLGGDVDVAAQIGSVAGAWLDLRGGRGAQSRVLGLFGRLYVHGVRFNARPLAAIGARRVPLPTYPFENRRYHFKPIPLPGESAAPPVAVATTVTMAAPTTAAAMLTPAAAAPATIAPAIPVAAPLPTPTLSPLPAPLPVAPAEAVLRPIAAPVPTSDAARLQPATATALDQGERSALSEQLRRELGLA